MCHHIPSYHVTITMISDLNQVRLTPATVSGPIYIKFQFISSFNFYQVSIYITCQWHSPPPSNLYQVSIYIEFGYNSQTFQTKLSKSSISKSPNLKYFWNNFELFHSNQAKKNVKKIIYMSFWYLCCKVHSHICLRFYPLRADAIKARKLPNI